MFTLPRTAAGWVGFVVLWWMVAVFARYLTRTATREWRRRRHVDFVRVLEVPLGERRPINAVRRDPSPSPRVGRLADADRTEA